MITTSVRIEPELAMMLDNLAASMDRSKTWIIERAIRSYVEEQAWQIEAILEAQNSYKKGKVKTKPHAKVMKRLKAKIDSKSS